MTQIGPKESVLFALSADHLAEFLRRVDAGQLASPASVIPHGRTGGLVRFRSMADVLLAKMAIV